MIAAKDAWGWGVGVGWGLEGGHRDLSSSLIAIRAMISPLPSFKFVNFLVITLLTQGNRVWRCVCAERPADAAGTGSRLEREIRRG